MLKENRQLRVAIVGASTLMGKEIKTVLGERRFPVSKLVLMDDDADLGRLAEFEGEPVFSQAISEGSFEFLDVAFFAGDPVTTQTYAPLAQKLHFLSVDLTHAFPEGSGVPLFLASAEDEARVAPMRGLISSPHPAALSIAAILRRIGAQVPIRSSVVTMLQPASEQGSPGVEELERQTLNIFSFQKMPQTVFDGQLAFNLMGSLGQEAKANLVQTEALIAGHLRMLLAPVCPLPAITLIQAPIFHSYAFSIFLDLDVDVTAEELGRIVSSDSVTLLEADEPGPSPVQAAGTDTVQLGLIKRDFLHPNAFWIWAASDNLRISAINAVHAAESVLLT
ncbi:MAG: Asd/ArgC dimerization domain-containing protein [Acidobacteriota bacterium]